MNNLTKYGYIFSLFLMLVATHSLAADWNTNNEGIVLDGYDVVAYKTEDSARQGLAEYSAQYDGVTFYFTSEKNRELFTSEPTQYIPKYNGYCAFAVGANNTKVPASPDTFKYYNGELLVFFNDLYEGNKFNTKVPWNENEGALYTQAQQNWTQLK